MRLQLPACALAAVTAAGCAASAPAIATHVQDWRDQVIYELVVDRFADGDRSNDAIDGAGTVPGDLTRFQGGDWLGILDHLDYLQDLGVTTLWISPVVANVEHTNGRDGYHGYWAADFTKPNPHFGSLDDLRALVDGAHARHMKVIMGAVTNHTGQVFFYDLNRDGKPEDGEREPPFDSGGPIDAPIVWFGKPPRMWLDDPADPKRPAVLTLSANDFHRRGQFGDSGTLERQLGDFPDGLRDLDTESDEVLNAMVDTYVHWVELTDVDGLRLDAVPHVPHAFWRAFCARVHQRLAAEGKHNFLLLGEDFDADPAHLASYNADGMDSVFDFSLNGALIDGVILDGKPTSTAVPALSSYREDYPQAPSPDGIGVAPWQARVAFADNHDMPRLRYWLNDEKAAELAMTVVFTVDAIPEIYYGTEQDFTGGWNDADREVLWNTGFTEDTRMFHHIAHLAALRRRSVALRRGDLVVRYASQISGRDHGPGAGLLAWERSAPGDRVLVAINAHPRDHAQAAVPTGFAPGTNLCDALNAAASCFPVAADGTVSVDVPPRTAFVLMPK